MSVYGPMRTPDEVVDLLVAVARHADGATRRQHIAEVARVKGLGNGIPDFRTVGRLGDEDDERKPQDALPALMFFSAGTSAEPEADENRILWMRWIVGVEVSYLGTTRADAIRGADWYTMAAVQMVMQRTPRGGLLDRLKLVSIEPAPMEFPKVRSVRALFEAWVPDSLALDGATTIDPEELDPVEFPDDWPTVTKAQADVDRAPL